MSTRASYVAAAVSDEKKLGSRPARMVVTALVVALISTATGCAASANSSGTVSPSSSVASALPRQAEDAPQVRAEVSYSATDDDRAVSQVAVGLGSNVELVVKGNLSGPVHLRGYDSYAEPDRGSNVLRFIATRPGRFVVEHDETGRVIAEVEVGP